MSKPRPLPRDREPITIVDVPEASRYEARTADGGLAALLDYRRSDEGWIALLHTEVNEDFEGRGVGSRLATGVFEDIRQRGLKIVPKCPFIVRWLERHPEQHDVLLRPLPGAGASPPGRPRDPV